MVRAEPFDRLAQRYDGWFTRHPHLFQAEVRAIRELLPASGRVLEVGVGTGRFARALGVEVGVEPAPAAADLARERGIDVHPGVAEDLPFDDGVFDAVLMVTTICFLDDVDAALAEARRVLRPGGPLVVALVDRSGPLGPRYVEASAINPFYRLATFYSASEVATRMLAAGFRDLAYRQTLFADPDQVDDGEPVREGHGEGGFAVVRGRRPLDLDW